MNPKGLLRKQAVTSIVGQTRLDLKFTGHANHAGTTPMHLRRDALAASAEWIGESRNARHQNRRTRSHRRQIEVHPNAGNVIPGSVDLSLDVRHAHDSTRTHSSRRLSQTSDAIATRRGLNVEWNKKMDEPSVPMDERLTAFMTDAIEVAAFPVKSMISGAGHDAMIMARRMCLLMLFFAALGGLSHHPDESAREEDIEAALLLVGEKFLQRPSAEVR